MPSKMVAVPESLVNALGTNLRDLYRLSRSKLDGPGDTMLRALLLEFDEWHDFEGPFAPKVGEPTGYRVVPEETVWKRAGDLRPGDRLDLEADEFADPEKYADPNADGRVELEFETFLIEDITREGDTGIVVYSQTSGGNYAFPVDHLVKYVSHDRDMDEGDERVDAEAHSDDRKIELDFNAAAWFEQASDQDIRDLAEIDWGGDYASDAVAQFYSDSDLKKLFAYVGVVDDCGYECNVVEESAMTWLRSHRPALADELTALKG
jgi:hypothetical protein